MTKEPIQDMIPPHKRSIRRIGISRSSKKPRPRIQQETGRKTPIVGSVNRTSRPWALWVIVLLVLIGLGGVLVSLFFSGAEIRVIPRQEVVTINGTFSARQGAEFGELSYEVMKVEQSASREVLARGEEQVERKANGFITVYNTFDENPQRLIKNTRFESPEGLVFRIAESIVVPGMKGDTPGSVEARVDADTSGAEYNINPTRFTIPGLESDAARFKAFYAESTQKMKGGFSGVTKVVSADDQAIAERELETELRAQLLSAGHAQTPEGFLLFDEGTFITFETPVVEESTNATMATLTMRGTLYGFVFDEKQLGEYIALQTVSNYERSPVVVYNPETLEVSLPQKETLIPTGLERVDVVLAGTPRLVWQFDVTTLVNDLLGKQKDFAESIFERYPAIQSAEVVVRPFWRSILPEDPNKIEVQVEIEE